MKVKVENLVNNITAEMLRNEFRRIGPCKVDLHPQDQSSWATLDFPDIVQVQKAIKEFNGKEIQGKNIRLSIFEELISLNPSRVRPRSRSRSPQNQQQIRIPTTKSSIVTGIAVIPWAKTAVRAEEIKLNEVPTTVVTNNASKASQAPLNTAPKASEEAKSPEKASQPVKKQEETKKEAKQISEVKESPQIVETAKSSLKTQETAGDDDLMIEAEDGSKFLKSEDPSKLHCISCDKTIAKKSLKQHIGTKAHKEVFNK